MNLSQKKLIEKYLVNYGEVELNHYKSLHIKAFENCLVIPAYQEEYQSLKKVWAAIGKNVLIILVVNAPIAGDKKTQELIKNILLDARTLSHRKNQNLSFLVNSEGHSILVVDRCSVPIPSKLGVGLARKIGADIALSMIISKHIITPWIYCTDADVSLPSTYFHAIENISKKSSAFIYAFRHQTTDEHQEACLLYEASLLYYVAGLRFASSAYAHPTIGSTIVISAYSYAAVRGFPCRSAGEDFYLLNKLAKVGKIQQLRTPTITISGRLSDRVPFGTGVGIKRIVDRSSPDSEYLFYNPKVFLALKALLERLRNCQDISNFEEYFLAGGIYGSILIQWSETQQLFDTIRSKQSQKGPVFDKFIHDWMDGFRTLKFIHFVRDNHFPSIPWPALFDGIVLPAKGPTENEIEIQQLHTALRKVLEQP
ncbi:MAG: hypothetical protein ACI9FB_000270 [Candidatus Azotimanducaceae bacterium]